MEYNPHIFKKKNKPKQLKIHIIKAWLKPSNELCQQYCRIHKLTYNYLLLSLPHNNSPNLLFCRVDENSECQEELLDFIEVICSYQKQEALYMLQNTKKHYCQLSTGICFQTIFATWISIASAAHNITQGY